jgi:hypothetical protein
MTARTAAVLVSGVLTLAAAACTNFYEIPIETPIKPKLDVSPFQRVHVVGFIAGGSDDVDANLETVRLLRSQLRTRSNLRVIEADVLPLAEIAQEQAREALAQHGIPGAPATTTNGSANDATSGIVAMPLTTPNGAGSASPQEKAAEGQQQTPPTPSQPTQGQPTQAPPATPEKPTTDKPATDKPAGQESKPAGQDAKPAQPGQARPGSQAEALAARIKDEKDLAAYERLFANTAYWKKLGEEYQQPLIVTGTVLFTPQQKSGIVTQQREVYDQLGRRQNVMSRVYQERKGYVLRPKFVFIDGRTGATIYSESFREERLYPAAQNTPALSSYFEMMDTLIPSFLNTLSTQKVRGTRVLLR